LKGEPPTQWRQSLLLEIAYSRAVVTQDWKYLANRPTAEALAAMDADRHRFTTTGERRTVHWSGRANPHARWGEQGIRVNTVAPGPIKTESQPADVPDAAFTQRMSLERFGTPEEIGETVAFLCSDRASFTTGHCYSVDGGLTVSGVMQG